MTLWERAYTGCPRIFGTTRPRIFGSEPKQTRPRVLRTCIIYTSGPLKNMAHSTSQEGASLSQVPFWCSTVQFWMRVVYDRSTCVAQCECHIQLSQCASIRCFCLNWMCDAAPPTLFDRLSGDCPAIGGLPSHRRAGASCPRA